MLRDNIIRSTSSSNIQWQGSWGDGTSYVINDLVEHNGSSYIALSSHVSTSNDEPGVGVNWETYWVLFAAAGVDGIDGADGADGAPGAPGQDGVYTRCDELILEMEMEFKTAYLCYYKEFAYNAQKLLIDIDIYTDTTANISLFHKDLIYNAQKNLIQTDLIRISDGAILTSIFNYNVSKQLISIERNGYCSCSSSSSSVSSSSSSSSI
jgi:hypothetical protein